MSLARGLFGEFVNESLVVTREGGQLIELFSLTDRHRYERISVPCWALLTAAFKDEPMIRFGRPLCVSGAASAPQLRRLNPLRSFFIFFFGALHSCCGVPTLRSRLMSIAFVANSCLLVVCNLDPTDPGHLRA